MIITIKVNVKHMCRIIFYSLMFILIRHKTQILKMYIVVVCKTSAEIYQWKDREYICFVISHDVICRLGKIIKNMENLTLNHTYTILITKSKKIKCHIRICYISKFLKQLLLLFNA